MPRDASGNYTLPLPDVAAGTTIESDWANTTLNDLAQEISDSLSRSGNGGLLEPLLLVNGSAPAPALAFASEPTTGLYRQSAGVAEFRVQNEGRLRITATNDVQIYTGASPSWQRVVATDAAPTDNFILQYDATAENWTPVEPDASLLTAGVLDDARVQESNVTQHEAALTLAAYQVTSGTFANARISEASVTQHEAALSIDFGQITNFPPGGGTHTHSASQITSGTFADARIAESNVTQHQGALVLVASQITSGTFANARISEASVTQHEGALSIDASQVSGSWGSETFTQVSINNGASLARLAIRDTDQAGTVYKDLYVDGRRWWAETQNGASIVRTDDEIEMLTADTSSLANVAGPKLFAATQSGRYYLEIMLVVTSSGTITLADLQVDVASSNLTIADCRLARNGDGTFTDVGLFGSVSFDASSASSTCFTFKGYVEFTGAGPAVNDTVNRPQIRVVRGSGDTGTIQLLEGTYVKCVPLS